MNDRAPPMKPTPTPEMIDAFIIAKESADRRLYGFHNLGRHFILDGTTEVWFTASDDYEVGHAAMMAQLERLRVDAALSTALSVPAAAVVGEPERDALRRRIYADLAKEGGGTWATYVCMDIFALEDAAFKAGKEDAPSAPDELRRIGAQMSNILFNLSQGGDIPERFRKQFRDLTREWDAALGGASHD